MPNENNLLTKVGSSNNEFINRVRDLNIVVNELEKDIFIDELDKIKKMPIDQKLEYYKEIKDTLHKDLNLLTKIKENDIDQKTKMLQDLLLTLSNEERELIASFLLEIIKKRRSINN